MVLAAAPDPVTPGLSTNRSGIAAAAVLRDLTVPLTAIFAPDDDMAAAAV